MNETDIINGAIVAFAIAMVAIPFLVAALGLCCLFNNDDA